MRNSNSEWKSRISYKKVNSIKKCCLMLRKNIILNNMILSSVGNIFFLKKKHSHNSPNNFFQKVNFLFPCWNHKPKDQIIFYEFFPHIFPQKQNSQLFFTHHCKTLSFEYYLSLSLAFFMLSIFRKLLLHKNKIFLFKTKIEFDSNHMKAHIFP